MWHEDAFEISNPDVFRMPIVEAMKPGSSGSRNETLLSIFALVNVREHADSSTDKIASGRAWAGHPGPTLGPSALGSFLSFGFELPSGGIACMCENPCP